MGERRCSLWSFISIAGIKSVIQGSLVVVCVCTGGQLPVAVTIRSNGPAHPTLIVAGAGFVFHVLGCMLLSEEEQTYMKSSYDSRHVHSGSL